ncbi:MAG: formylglycine-generating enzyme family protein [Deltaproteobacteria bacterium]|nr:formylglycine-generating enzyme family protein [Deltaproteobacteria bacterium]
MKRYLLLSFLIVLLPACNKTKPIDGDENTLGKCSDDIDNDGDGLIDCKDKDCKNFSVCSTSDSDTETDKSTDSDTEKNSDSDSDSYTDSDSDILTQWATIKNGSFWMGSPDGNCPAGYPQMYCDDELQRQDNEELVYITLTNSFEMMTTEVTREQFADIFGFDTSCYDQNAECDSDLQSHLNYPVVNLAIAEAALYANKLSEKEGLPECYSFDNIVCNDEYELNPEPFPTGQYTDPKECMNKTQHGIKYAIIHLNYESPYKCTGYRLPTEAEWEYAARAGSYTPFYPAGSFDGSYKQDNVGECYTPLQKLGWVCDEETTGPVAQFLPNAWDLYDMIGNVAEQVWDGARLGWNEKQEGSGHGTFDAPTVNPYIETTGYSQWSKGCTYTATSYNCRLGTTKQSGAAGTGVGFRLVKTIVDN